MEKRKTNIDLLKIFAMYGIIIFHHFGNNTLNHIVQLSGDFSNDTYFYDFVNNMHLSRSHVPILSLLMDFCYGHFGNGGNFIFMLITGYFLFGRDISFSKRVKRVASVLYAILFHGIILTLINCFLLVKFYPFSSYKTYRPLFTLPNWFSGDNMWYLQAYGCFILFVLPLLKRFEGSLTRKKHLYLLLTLIFAHFLAYNTYFPNLWVSSRLLYFPLFYYVGGYISKYGFNIKTKHLFTISIFYLLIYFAYEYYWRYACSIMYEPSKYSYIKVMQPFVCCLIYAIICFLVFTRIRVPKSFSNVVSTISDKTIGIYIFHANFINISFIAADYLGWDNWTRKGYFLFAIIDSIVLFVVGFFIDVIRKWSYKHIEKAINYQVGLNS